MPERKRDRIKEAAGQGVSLPIVICAGALLLAFALAFAYTASLMMANANRKLKEERCYQLAKSFSQVLDAELRSSDDSSFRTFANIFLNDTHYAEYDSDVPSTIYYYALQEQSSEDYGDIRIRLRKEVEIDAEDMEDRTWEIITSDGANVNYTDEIEKLRTIPYKRYILTVDAVAECGDISYVYSTEYYREDTYDVEFTYEGRKIVWDANGGTWKYDNVAGGEVSFSEDAEIKYSYLTDNPRSWVYEPLHTEKE